MLQVHCSASIVTQKSRWHCITSLFVLLLKEAGISGDYVGDGTGYSVGVDSYCWSDSRRYGKKYCSFFSLIDFSSGMYVGCGVSCRSEWGVFTEAVVMLRRVGAAMKLFRLDRYFSM